MEIAPENNRVTMFEDRTSLDVLLGTGGDEPGIDVYCIDSDQCRRIRSFSRGESIYALSWSPGHAILAAGSKRGFLYLIVDATAREGDQDSNVRRLVHGFPILSVCFLDCVNVAVSDTAARCLIWNLSGEMKVHKLPTGRETICALFCLGGDRVAGISEQGELRTCKSTTTA